VKGPASLTSETQRVPQKICGRGPLRLEHEPARQTLIVAPPFAGGAALYYFACALRAANSASLRSVMTPISLAR
jgi:hypothetical protein